MTPIKTPKKLIEVALPLDDINEACTKEKSIRHGHPSTLHLWWARRPLAAARAVIFAQMVNDPGGNRGYGPGMTKAQAQIERERLFGIIRRLVLWENTGKESVLLEARAEILKSWKETCELNRNHPLASELFDPSKPPAFHDPFAGGGTIPLEAQRLGLESYASDLNPVAVLINKAMIEIPSRFSCLAPVGPIPSKEKQTNFDRTWVKATGMAEDLRRYGGWMREEALRRIGKYYPEVDLPKAIGGGKATVIAWLWARTVKSPNPAYSHVDVPLVSSFILSSRVGKESYVVPDIEGDRYSFRLVKGKPTTASKAGTKIGRGGNFQCLLSGTSIPVEYIREQGKLGRMGARLLAIVAESSNGRLYLAPDSIHEATALSAVPEWSPTQLINHNPRDIRTQLYGLMTYADLFTPRQLLALTTFSGLVDEARSLVKADAILCGMKDDGVSLEAGGSGATAYADAIAVYLAFSIDKASDYWSSICSWHSSKELIRNTFGRQAIPMTWDYAETNPFSDSAGNVSSGIDWAKKAIELFPVLPGGRSVSS
jgi:putative DNA methylase